MKFQTKKLAVLHCLSQEERSISLHELLEKLGNDFAERSVRRWVAEMVTEGLIEKIGDKRGTKYKFIQHQKKHVPIVALDQLQKKYSKKYNSLFMKELLLST